MKMSVVSARAALLVALLSVSLPVWTDELQLLNGDRLYGTLVKVEGDQVTWHSDTFGDLTVAKSKLKQIQVSAQVKLKGQREACRIGGLEGAHLLYRCGKDGKKKKTELAIIDRIVPFVEHSASEYSYSGKTSVAISMKRGNEVKDDIDIDTGVEFRTSDWRHIAAVNYESRSTDAEPSEEIYNLNYRLDWFFSDRWFWFNRVGVGMDEPKNISERYVYGTGLGVQLWEYSHSALSLASGLEFVKESFDPTVADRQDPNWESTQDIGYWTLSYSFRHKLPYSINLVSSSQMHYSLEDSQDWEVDMEVGVNMPLGRGLFSEYKLEYDYDNLPNGNNRKADKKLTVGVGYKW